MLSKFEHRWERRQKKTKNDAKERMANLSEKRQARLDSRRKAELGVNRLK
jgi:hypothetical protein